MPYPGWSPKEIRQYRHIKESSGGNKSMAAATVNKFKKKKRGRGKRKRH